MDCEKCNTIEAQFDKKVVTKKLHQYRLKGPKKETKILINALKSFGINGHTLLDVGGGFGGLAIELLKVGVISATNVEASSAYLDGAKTEATRHGFIDQISLIQDDFVSVANQIKPAEIVTLDKVICCYDDMISLVKASVEKAKKLYGVIYPRDTWWVKLVIGIENFIRKAQGNGFRVFVHPTQEVDRIVRENGLKRVFYRELIDWQIVVYAR
jgi:2-polyprenyl-3-methyl-5-hydroxy-6-metoxy-1,4-benzoquinol methylase